MTKQNESDTKQRLLDAAIKIFAAKGFIAATIREICLEAQVNVAAVNYHFGDKSQLYGTVLNHIFAQHAASRDPELLKVVTSDAPALERLRAHIYIGVLQTYKDKQQCGCNCFDTNETDNRTPFSIFLMEMAHPTSHLDGVVEEYIRPEAIELSGILHDYFGPKADEGLIRQCSDSIWGQILRSALCWPIEIRLNGENSQGLDPHALAEHICRFTIGGLQHIKQQLDSTTE